VGRGRGRGQRRHRRWCGRAPSYGGGAAPAAGAAPTEVSETTWVILSELSETARPCAPGQNTVCPTAVRQVVGRNVMSNGLSDSRRTYATSRGLRESRRT
jgi:hypothetical protein